jgi:hypothetical protein
MSPLTAISKRCVLCLPVLLAVCALCAFSAPAFANISFGVECFIEGTVSTGLCRPGWEVTTRNYPTNLPPGGSGIVQIDVYNIGAGIPNHSVTVTDVLPAGLVATNAGEDIGNNEEGAHTGVPIGIKEHGLWECTGTTVVTCTLEHAPSFPLAAGGAGAGLAMQINIAVEVEASAKEGTKAGAEGNHVTVSGGGAPAVANNSQPLTISSSPASTFAFTGADAWFSNANGTIDTQAGSHPYSATFTFDLATALKDKGSLVPAGGEVYAIEEATPPGLVGDPNAVPQCTRALFRLGECPSASQIGMATITLDAPSTYSARVYNMVPPVGVPAEFAFNLAEIGTFLDASVRSGSDYGITERINNIAQRDVNGSSVTLWGYPADPSHNYWRSHDEKGCDNGRYGGINSKCAPEAVAGGVPKAFLTLPTACAGPQTIKVHGDTWENPDITSEMSSLTHDAQDNPVGITGCENLSFNPSITAAPDTSYADTPAGLTVEVKPSVGGLSEPEGLSSSDIQNTTVTLPRGVAINPGQAAGLQACGPAEDGLTTEAEKAAGQEDNNAPSCPNASKVGTVAISTPLLSDKLEGDVYVLQSNPPNLKLLVAASAEGVNLKLVGDVHLDETTGQLTTTFAGTPELPFTDFKLAFSGGAQAALTTPTQCGVYSTEADFTPWSNPFTPDFLESNSFAITGGPDGSACPSNPLPFSPSLTAGSTTDQAGGFTSFSLLLQAPDAQQRISKLQFKVPEGLSGMISKVPLCGEAQANAGTCSSASQIGHTVVASGPGPYPLVVPQPGQPPAAIYLTGPYEGAPFGLSIVVPVVVGPFVLQTQVVRAKIEVDPYTAQITVTTNPLPQIIDGVPTDLRTVNAVINREGFMFNPTNCTPQSFSGTATSAQGAQAPISSPFGVGSCRSLEFKPKFTVSTSGKTSKANGASLTAKIVYPATPPGSNLASAQANFTRVKVDLPKQLPSRLTTLQKACTNAQFELNPANCPKESKIGYATVHTPLLPVPVSGPAIFVSHGGEAFPSLTMVLQGDNVTVDLVGTTFISRAGITSTTFKTVPDVPFSSFELTLPQGKYSALAANGNLCTSKLAMPTEFLAQNGLKINESTPISVVGCAKVKALTRSQKLAKALKACKRKPQGQRARCEKQARARYGPVKGKKK